MKGSKQLHRKIILALPIFLCVYFLLWERQRNYKPPLPLSYHESKSIRPSKSIRSISEEVQPEQSDWQEVAGSQHQFTIYSAYHILGRSPSEVLIIGLARTFTNESISCRIHFRDEDKQQNNISKYIEIPGTTETMQEHWNKKYSGVFIHCALPSNIKPEMVSILLTNQTEPSNMIRIQHKMEVGPQSFDFKFSLCVLPIYDYNQVFHLLEWIEFYKLMGVEQITLYNVSIGPESSCILRNLMGGSDPQIKVNVHPWHKNPIKDKHEIRSPSCGECAIIAAANDCLYRHRGRSSKYMVFVDLDEYILPRENIARNYHQLFAFLHSQHPGQNFSHYLFKNGFFAHSRPNDPLLATRCSEFRSDVIKSRICNESLMMSRVWREDYQPYSSRTKYIIKPEGVKMVGNHFATLLEPGYSTLKVDESIAFSRHYRYVYEGKHTEIDRAPQVLGMELVNNLANRMKYFIKKCRLEKFF